MKRKVYIICVGCVHSGKSLLRHSIKHHEEKHLRYKKYDMSQRFIESDFTQAIEIEPNNDFVKVNPNTQIYFISMTGEENKKVHIQFINDYKFLTYIRDPRLLWMLCKWLSDKLDENQCKTHIKHINLFMNFYKCNIMNNYNNLNIKFELMSNNYDLYKIMIYNHFDLNVCNSVCISKPVNNYLTDHDIGHSKFCKQHLQSQKYWDMISTECSEYINYFGYKQRLLIEDVLN